MTENISLPSWEFVSTKMDAGEDLNPIEQFVHDNEPAGKDDDEFRRSVCAMLAYVANGYRSALSKKEEEIGRLTGLVAHYQGIGGKQGSKLMRMGLLLDMARQWGISSRAYDGSAAVMIAHAVEKRFAEPILWPSSPFVQKWLAENGWSDCNGKIGMRLRMNLLDKPEPLRAPDPEDAS